MRFYFSKLVAVNSSLEYNYMFKKRNETKQPTPPNLMRISGQQLIQLLL